MPRRRHSNGWAATLLLATTACAQAANPYADWDSLPKEDKLLWGNVAGVGFITAWGVAFWDYGARKPHTGSEGWFGEDTKNGGADKLGHFYSDYVIAHVLASTYEGWGYSPNRAAALGALSSFGLMSYMEFGDAFSDYGFAYEDLIMNGLGAYAGYLLYRYPAVARKIDLRLEYLPDFKTFDFFTDYEQMKYVLAVKLDGFESTANSWLRYFDLQVGYYARGYEEDKPNPPQRNVYAAVGVNLSHLFGAAGHAKTAKFFNYYQMPYTYVAATKDLNE